MTARIDRRDLLKWGGAAGLTAGAAAVIPRRAEAVTPTPTGVIAIERLWRYSWRYTKTYYYDTRGRRRYRYVKSKVLRTKRMYQGTDKRTLGYGGLCHWVGTPKPLEDGNCVLFGHRTTAGGPLRYLNRVVVGDQIVVSMNGQGSKTYRVVVAPFVIGNRDFAQAINWGDSSHSHLTLVACTKTNKLPTSTRYRLLVRATEV